MLRSCEAASRSTRAIAVRPGPHPSRRALCALLRMRGAYSARETTSSVITTRLLQRLPRVEGVAHRLADEDQQREHQGDDDEAGEAEPGRLQIGLPLQQEFAERGRAGRQAKAEKIQRGQRRDRAV